MNILFKLGPFTIYKLGFFVALGILAGMYLVLKEAKRKSLNEDDVLNFSMLIIISGFIGARLLFVLLDLPFYLKNPAMILHVNEGGLSFHGAILGGLIAAVIYTRMKKINFFKLADIVAPSLALAYGIGRIGCDIYGKANWFGKFLDKLAKANEKEFAGKKMDCCELHRNQDKDYKLKVKKH
jgi:phosphatidylglycerol:prolipoprotein diacylglycerol transferase